MYRSSCRREEPQKYRSDPHSLWCSSWSFSSYSLYAYLWPFRTSRPACCHPMHHFLRALIYLLLQTYRMWQFLILVWYKKPEGCRTDRCPPSPSHNPASGCQDIRECQGYRWTGLLPPNRQDQRVITGLLYYGSLRAQASLIQSVRTPSSALS